MSISPPSDIVLDVVRAADPARYAEAAARLTRIAAANAEPFAEALAAPNAPNLPPAAPPSAPATVEADAYLGFEAMVLATLIEATMPDQLSAVFGSGTAGGIWKSMLAEQLGAAMARAGGIGIARQLEADAAERSATEALLIATVERRVAREAKPDIVAVDDSSVTGWPR